MCEEGLVPAMFLDGEGREVANGDPRCGLYIRSRQKVCCGVPGTVLTTPADQRSISELFKRAMKASYKGLDSGFREG